MRRRWIVVVALGLLALFVAPQAGLTVPPQDDSELRWKERVKPNIEMGVDYLRRTQHANGTWTYKGDNNPNTPQVVGATALCGLALMEAGVPANDPQVRKAAGIVRSGAGKYNYGNTLCILFLDRLHRNTAREVNGVLTHGDSSTIQQMAGMIVNGQAADGGWGYFYPGSNTDNSNTQFAIVALWIARKYSKPGGNVDKALKGASEKFKRSQHSSGAWAYDQAGTPMEPSPSMTCAGLIGLAVGVGTDRRQQEATFSGRGASPGGTGTLIDPHKKLSDDPQVAKAKVYLLNSVPLLAGERAPPEHSTYFWWSLERTCKLFRWKKINDMDWFAYGATWLLSKQNQRTGGWAVDDLMSSPSTDTAFALLFLAQSNLMGDLVTATFSGGEAVTSGPVLGPRPKPAAEKKDPAVHSAELVKKLLDASPGKQRNDILSELEEARGGEYTVALANAIEKIGPSEAAKDAAREALRKRLQRLKNSSLAQYMVPDEQVELRRAAVAAARYKNDMENVEIVIPMLADKDPAVREEAHAALRSLSGQDVGTSTERWAKWLEKYKKTQKKEE